MPLIQRICNGISLVACLQLVGCGRTALGADSSAQCDATCQACGNSWLDGEEQCDDGNVANGDGCSSRCQWEPISIACGEAHTCAIGANGKLLCWGYNGNGRLGLGDKATRGDEPNEMGHRLPTVDLGDGASVVSVAASRSTCAVLDNAEVRCWGDNQFGQLGLDDLNDRGDNPGEMGLALPMLNLGTTVPVTSVSVDVTVACALFEDGRAKCWGKSMQGQLGAGTTSPLETRPSSMGDALGYLDLGAGRAIRLLKMSRESGVSCAILDDDGLKCWGYGDFGALGLEDRENRGDQPGEMGDNLPNVQLGSGQTAIALALGGSHSCAILEGRVVKCWGNNPAGELGLGDRRARGFTPGDMGDALPFVNLGTGRHALTVAAGYDFTCAMLEGGTVKCWGSNVSGQLGLGDTRSRGEELSDMGDNLEAVALGTGRTARAICAGAAHACALLDSGVVKCWGMNLDGQLGIGTDGMNKSFVPGPQSEIGDAPGEMGDNLAAVDLRF